MHWPIFEDEKRERVEIGVLIFTISRAVLKSLPQNGDVEKRLIIIHNACHFNIEIKIWKLHKFSIKDWPP